MRRRPPLPLLVPPLLLCTMLVAVLILASCIEGEEPETTAPGPPPGEEFGDVPTGIAGGNELTPAIDPCTDAVPAAIVEPGERQTVIGDVINISETEDAQGTVTLLEMGEEGGDVPFAIAIPEDSQPNFVGALERYAGRELCVNGVVQDFRGTPVIFVTNPNEIVTAGE